MGVHRPNHLLCVPLALLGVAAGCDPRDASGPGVDTDAETGTTGVTGSDPSGPERPDPDPATTGSPGGSADDGGAPQTPTDPLAPQIVSFSTNVTSLTENEQIVFSAIVTDPDGIDDVIGGTLETPDGQVFGSFTTTAQEGAYGLSLRWDQIDQVSTIAFEYGAHQVRTFVARFYDQGARESTASVEVELTCEGRAACDGHCVNTMASSNHCGACGMACTGGTCCEGACRSLQDDAEHCGGCGNACGQDEYCEWGLCYEDDDEYGTTGSDYGTTGAYDGAAATDDRASLGIPLPTEALELRHTTPPPAPRAHSSMWNLRGNRD